MYSTRYKKGIYWNNLTNTFAAGIQQEDDTTILGLDYSTLVTVLCSTVKQLENKIIKQSTNTAYQYSSAVSI